MWASEDVSAPYASPIFVRLNLLLLGVAVALSLPWMHWVQRRDVTTALFGPSPLKAALWGLSVGALVAPGVWHLFVRVPAARAVLYRLQTVLRFDLLRGRDIGLIALSAGVGEELLFRGVVQPHLGLVPTAVLFGLAHPLTRWYVLYATAAGLLLGYLAQATESLLAPVLCHAVVDGWLLWRARAWARQHRDPASLRVEHA